MVTHELQRAPRSLLRATVISEWRQTGGLSEGNRSLEACLQRRFPESNAEAGGSGGACSPAQDEVLDWTTNKGRSPVDWPGV